MRAKHVGTDFLAGLKNMIGGELRGYTNLLEESRKEATARMVKQATNLGANAVINVRFATSSITSGAAEVYVYGTAVIVFTIFWLITATTNIIISTLPLDKQMILEEILSAIVQS